MDLVDIRVGVGGWISLWVCAYVCRSECVVKYACGCGWVDMDVGLVDMEMCVSGLIWVWVCAYVCGNGCVTGYVCGYVGVYVCGERVLGVDVKMCGYVCVYSRVLLTHTV